MFNSHLNVDHQAIKLVDIASAAHTQPWIVERRPIVRPMTPIALFGVELKIALREFLIALKPCLQIGHVNTRTHIGAMDHD